MSHSQSKTGSSFRFIIRGGNDTPVFVTLTPDGKSGVQFECQSFQPKKGTVTTLAHIDDLAKAFPTKQTLIRKLATNYQRTITNGQEIPKFSWLGGVQKFDSFNQQKAFATANYAQLPPKCKAFQRPPPQRNWKTCHRKEFCTNKNYAKKARRAYCFNGTAPIWMFDGSTKEIQNIKIGDILLSAERTPTVVIELKETVYNTTQDLIQLDDFWITKGHPIFLNSDWYRPDELFPPKEKYVDSLFNIFAYPSHNILVGRKQFICTSLGGFCLRIAQMDPYTDIIYGSGYGTPLAKRYSWLLSIEKRIPNDQVEAETDKYWNNLKMIESH